MDAMDCPFFLLLEVPVYLRGLWKVVFTMTTLYHLYLLTHIFTIMYSETTLRKEDSLSIERTVYIAQKTAKWLVPKCPLFRGSIVCTHIHKHNLYHCHLR